MAFQLDVSGTPQGPCSVCFGKGRWVGISDAAWHREGTRAKPDKPYSCGICRGSGLTKVTWSSLTPFTQGYVEALFAAGERDCERCAGNGEIITDHERYLHAHDGDVGDEAVAECPDCNGQGSHSLGGFSDLAPETLARIMEDCADACTAGPGVVYDNSDKGREFWAERQRGDYSVTLFPPLTVILSDDGKVRFADQIAARPLAVAS